jgi:hypothetical protein
VEVLASRAILQVEDSVSFAATCRVVKRLTLVKIVGRENPLCAPILP